MHDRLPMKPSSCCCAASRGGKLEEKSLPEEKAALVEAAKDKPYSHTNSTADFKIALTDRAEKKASIRIEGGRFLMGTNDPEAFKLTGKAL